MTQQMSHEVYKVAAVLLLGILTLASCYSVMPINDAKNVKENKRTAKTVSLIQRRKPHASVSI